jgi:hypothetical protein
MTSEDIYAQLNNICKNTHLIRRYIGLLSSDIVGGERHHILPKSIFPEYKNCDWNIVKVSLRKHYILHLILHKMLGGKMTTAFLLMCNRTKISSKEYECAREQMSVNLKGTMVVGIGGVFKRIPVSEYSRVIHYVPSRKKTDEFIKNNFVGKYVVYDSLTCEYKRISASEYNKDIHTFVGNLRDDKSRQKTSDAMSGRVMMTNGVDNRFVKPDDINLMLERGFWFEANPSTRVSKSGLLHYTINGEQHRGKTVPPGATRGRTNFGEGGNPFAGKKIARCILTKDLFSINKSDAYPKYYVPRDTKVLVRYNQFITYKSNQDSILIHTDIPLKTLKYRSFSDPIKILDYKSLNDIGFCEIDINSVTEELLHGLVWLN